MTDEMAASMAASVWPSCCRLKRLLPLIALVAGLWIWFCTSSLSSQVSPISHRHKHPLPLRPEAHAVSRVTNKSRKTIVLWTPFFSQENYVLPLDRYSCLHTNCDFTADRSLLSEADAVMFHVRDTNVNDLPSFRRGNQRWILLHHEAPPNTPVQVMQALNDRINWTVTYRSDSDVVLTPKYRRRLVPINQTQSINTSSKRRLVAWFVSNCKTDSRREDFVIDLRKTVTIDIFGSCGSYSCQPKMSHKCYETIEREYFFYLSLENSICKDYVTEKLFNILDYNVIPIVFGKVGQENFLPPRSFIDADDFPSTAALGQHLLRLAKDHKAYSDFFRWRREYEMQAYQHYACQICSKLNDERQESKTWSNLSYWWFEESRCRSWVPETGYE